MKHDLTAGGHLLLQQVVVSGQHGGQRQPGFGHAARLRKRQRIDLVLAVELIDLLVGRVV